MTKYVHIIILVLIISFASTSNAQNHKADSLKAELRKAKTDSSKVLILIKLLKIVDPSEFKTIDEQIIKICEPKITDPKHRLYKFYLAPLATVMYNQGSLADNEGRIQDAIRYLDKSLKLYENLKDNEGIARVINNLAIIYYKEGDATKSLEYFEKSFNLQEKLNDKEQMAIGLNNIGNVYFGMGEYDKALGYFGRSLNLYEELGDKSGIALALLNSSGIYLEQQNYNKGLEYLEKSLKMREKMNDKEGMSFCLINIGEVYLTQKKYALAEKYTYRSLMLSKELGYPENIQNAALELSSIYSAQKKFEKSLEMYKLYVTMRDSISNDETKKATVKRELQYNYEKKATADSIANAVQYEINEAKVQKKEAELKVKRNQQYILYGGLVVVLAFAGFMYNRFKVTNKQKQIIELKENETRIQKHLIEEKHKEITDSINYAERIQKSFLATKELLDKNLPDYFVLFKPKDVVSGDFYWAGHLNNGRFALVVADSTGHGVPGAIMSILNISSIEKAIEKENEPARILNTTRNLIIDRLKKDGSSEGGKDGMDCSLSVYDFKDKVVRISAANNPVWIVRSGEIIEIKPDKMPVGKHDKQDTPFTESTVQLQTNDIVYALTDGFPDQFGGEKGKKFMSKNLRALLAQNATLPMPEQKKLLEETLKKWIGKMEQVDDICIIGVKI